MAGGQQSGRPLEGRRWEKEGTMEMDPDLETDSHRPFLLLFWTCGWSFPLGPDRQTYTPPHPNMPFKTPPCTRWLYFLPNGYSFGLCGLTPVPSNPTTSPCQSQRTVTSDPGPPWPSRNTLPLPSESLLSWFPPNSQSHLPGLHCRPLFPPACPLNVNGPGLSTSSLSITPLASVTICIPRAPNL